MSCTIQRGHALLHTVLPSPAQLPYRHSVFCLLSPSSVFCLPTDQCSLLTCPLSSVFCLRLLSFVSPATGAHPLPALCLLSSVSVFCLLSRVNPLPYALPSVCPGIAPCLHSSVPSMYLWSCMPAVWRFLSSAIRRPCAGSCRGSAPKSNHRRASKRA